MLRLAVLLTAGALTSMALSASAQAGVAQLTMSLRVGQNGDGGFTFESPPSGFNTELGTLTGVSYTIQGVIDGTYHITAGDQTVLDASFANRLMVGGLQGFDNTFTLPQTEGRGTFSSIDTGNISVNVSFSAPTSALGIYTDGGPIDLDFGLFTSITDLDNNTTSPFFQYATFSFEGGVAETFTYTTVPEPASVALFGLGLMGLGLVGSARKWRGRIECVTD